MGAIETEADLLALIQAAARRGKQLEAENAQLREDVARWLAFYEAWEGFTTAPDENAWLKAIPLTVQIAAIESSGTLERARQGRE